MTRIVVDQNIHLGKPNVTRIQVTVRDVVELLTDGLFLNEIIQDYYLELVAEDIRACLQLRRLD